MRIKHIAPEGWQRDLEPALIKLGHEIVDDNPDVILSKSVTQMKKTIEAVRQYTSAIHIEYNWDVYSWALNNPRKDEYNYKQYKSLCALADEVWVPSRAVQNSLRDFWEMDSHVMVSWCPQYPLPEDVEVKDGGYALQALRNNPDIKMDWYEKACRETGIKYELTWAKELDEADYRKLLAHAGFLVSALHEMSTGGQFLSEGAALGKPILSAKGRYLGAEDYFGDTICYYDGDNFEDLKDKIKKMSTGELRNDTEAAKKRILSQTPDWFAKKAVARINDLLKRS
jgi:hypothetical protein